MKRRTKFFAIFFCTAFNLVGHSQATYDNCADALANPITLGDPASCGETATPAGTEAGECLTNWAGNQNSTMWASFTATDDSAVINYVETTSDGEMLKVYGPNSGCQPPCGDQIYSAQQVGDPGHHILLTGLTVGAVYLVQIDATDPNSPSQFSDLEYCFGISEPSDNGLSSGATLIDECGFAFTETTDGGFWQSGTGTGFANLDGNAGTTCGGCTAGNDVSFVINNAAWNTFCSLTTGTWTITVDNVSNCQLTGAGVQAVVFTGTSTNLTNEGQSSPVPAGGWTSPVITVNSGDCAFLMIDGFAGDICEYDVTLTNVSGGCVITVLSVDFKWLALSQSENGTLLNWEVASESNNNKYIIERSDDGENWSEIGTVKSIGNHTSTYNYEYLDDRNKARDVYYRLSVEDNDGKLDVLSIKYLKLFL